MKPIREIITDFNRAIGGRYEMNRQVSEDLEFAKIAGAQWRAADLEQFKNKPKPENNLLFKNINRLLGQYQGLELNARISSASDDPN